MKTIVFLGHRRLRCRDIRDRVKMVDESDVVICYADMEQIRSGARRAIKYAMKQEKEVINLFKEEDRPFYGLTEKEIKYQWQKFIKG